MAEIFTTAIYGQMVVILQLNVPLGSGNCLWERPSLTDIVFLSGVHSKPNAVTKIKYIQTI